MNRTIIASLLAAISAHCPAFADGVLNLNDVKPVTTVGAAPSASGEVSSKGAVLPSRAVQRCSWESVAKKWQVNPQVLYAIAKTESNLNPRAVNRANENGSEDVGMMQINSWWFPKLAELGISRADLFTPCVSLDVAGWILSQNMSQHGNTWKAIGAYNAVTPWKQQRYAEKVFKNIQLAQQNGTN